jgi:TetR/AcrR family transcriptional regulator, transcriptional repressor for nem operon
MREREKPGRPRQFDLRETLAKIMDVFWVKGFDGTSLNDLVAATGLRKGSLYAAYGDKRAMYLQALRLYDETVLEDTVIMLGGKEVPMERIERFLRAAFKVEVGARAGRGCFLCNASVDPAAIDPESKAAISLGVDRLENAVREVLEALDIPAINVKERERQAGRILATYFGLRILARVGQSGTHLDDTVDATLRSIF